MPLAERHLVQDPHASCFVCRRAPAVQVTQAGLVADIEDAWRLQEHTLGCPMPQELQGSKPPIFSELVAACAQARRMRASSIAHLAACPARPCRPAAGCGALPEGLDPHSFRSTFGHNTNLWAFKRQPWFAKIGSAAALVPPTYDVRVRSQGWEVCAGRVHHLLVACSRSTRQAGVSAVDASRGLVHGGPLLPLLSTAAQVLCEGRGEGRCAATLPAAAARRAGGWHRAGLDGAAPTALHGRPPLPLPGCTASP